MLKNKIVKENIIINKLFWYIGSKELSILTIRWYACGSGGGNGGLVDALAISDWIIPPITITTKGGRYIYLLFNSIYSSHTYTHISYTFIYNIFASIDLITVNKFSSQRRPDNEWKIELIYFVCAIVYYYVEGWIRQPRRYLDVGKRNWLFIHDSKSHFAIRYWCLYFSNLKRTFDEIRLSAHRMRWLSYVSR